MKTKTLYAVLGVEREHQVSIGNFKKELILTWADRMCGVLPVFETKKMAMKYAGKTFKIMTMKIEVNK